MPTNIGTLQDLSGFSTEDLINMLGSGDQSGALPQLAGLDRSALPATAISRDLGAEQSLSNYLKGGSSMAGGINYNVSAPQGTMQIQPWQYAYETEMMNRYDPFMSQVRGYQTPTDWLQQKGGPEAFDPGLAAQNQLLKAQAGTQAPWQSTQELARWQTEQQSSLARALQQQKIDAMNAAMSQYWEQLSPYLGQYGLAGQNAGTGIGIPTEYTSLSNVELDPINKAYEEAMRQIAQSTGRGGGGARERAYQTAEAGGARQSAIANALTGMRSIGTQAGLTARGQNLGLLSQLLQGIRPSVSYGFSI